MNNTEIIQSLKDNKWVPYGGWTRSQRNMANHIGISYFVHRKRPDIWEPAKKEFDDFGIYCLAPDYEEKADIVERLLKIKDGVWQFTKTKSSHCWFGLHSAVNMPDFIGFRYKDERMKELNWHDVYPVPRIYIGPAGDIRTSFVFIDIALYEVLTPVAVLFRSTK